MANQAFFREQSITSRANCPICSPQYILKEVCLNSCNLNSLLSDLKEYEEIVISESGRLLYDSDFLDNTGMSLSSLGLRDGSLLHITADEKDTGKPVKPIIYILKNKAD